MTTRLSMAITPCPNDTWLAGALALGQVTLPDAVVEVVLDDIEALNRAALAGIPDVVKVSCALYGALESEYTLLDVGAAVVDGYGPLVLSRTPMRREDLSQARIAAPGPHTTGTALFRRWAPTAAPLQFARYDQLMPGLLDGRWDAAVVIHEARLTYPGLGLHCLVDLGAWWSGSTGLPVALGCYVMRRSAYARYGKSLEDTLRASLRRAATGDPAIAAWIARHAQEMDPQVLRDYIQLYVTPRTWQLDVAGREAILALSSRLHAGTEACA